VEAPSASFFVARTRTAGLQFLRPGGRVLDFFSVAARALSGQPPACPPSITPKRLSFLPLNLTVRQIFRRGLDENAEEKRHR
jgi:hypothetical protein